MTSSRDEHPVVPGAEAWSAPGGPAGALVLHGFTGNPSSMRPVAEALAAAGFTVELPRLPGHGTAIEDMMATGWADWYGAARAAYADLGDRCGAVVVVGLSMGGALALALAMDGPDPAGVVLINAIATAPEGMRAGVTELLAAGLETTDPVSSDVADPEVVESAYAETPLRPLLTLFDEAEVFAGRLGEITAPVLVMHSAQDHVVDPANAEVIATGVAGPVERCTLERSFHVATVDFDRELVAENTVDFARRVTTASS